MDDKDTIQGVPGQESQIQLELPRKQKRSGRTFVTIVGAILMLVIGGVVGALGATWYEKQTAEVNVEQTDDNSTVTAVTNLPPATEVCGEGEDIKATNGVFCSVEFGVKLVLPSVFAGKVIQLENEDVMGLNADATDNVVVGKTNDVYGATVDYPATPTKPATTYEVKISQSDVFDRASFGAAGNLDAATGKFYNYTTEGSGGTFKRGAESDAVLVDGLTLYIYTFGDVGTNVWEYVGVVNDKLIGIEYRVAPKDDPTDMIPDVLGMAEEVDFNPYSYMFLTKRVKKD